MPSPIQKPACGLGGLGPVMNCFYALVLWRLSRGERALIGRRGGKGMETLESGARPYRRQASKSSFPRLADLRHVPIVARSGHWLGERLLLQRVANILCQSGLLMTLS